ncbi:P-II family nitrogen regulator [Chlorobium phaeovibrioides]|uniref:P-II family nitrogen regulator n=2 Tax=Chlorobium phaeovibrioides TaxID=1094 RepID=A0A432AV61_CHLPH|nr:P-II family nitrogen regulator [Chlorobium phaeovibrioides]HCD36148.1 P-II family nitrogen regulator [Chlorobium sp.]KAA6232977.1 P-II family nitrogen regulator [Chlorobium phaeovibrioides]MWV53928.1 P-II family nitrogen regulator [Chlorobium phaeovibrioides]QEQ56631.1 P-II family nitrogen regulator [Chlorobium phaeovibrioides]RTY35275.1 P-II family nitrogen regulator [Chlorobium phaeovibrioides]
MLMIRTIVRPEKVHEVMQGLLDAGYPAVTKISVVGRGKQRGLRVGDVVYDELPKEMLFTVVPDADKDFVIQSILDNAKSTGEGKFGDGKIFVSAVEEVYTISTGMQESEPTLAAAKEA